MPQQIKSSSLYSESQAKDNCGFGLIVNRNGVLKRDVVIKSMKGNIRFEAAENIELYARKNIMMEANAQMDINAQNINVESRFCMKIKATSFLR